MSWCQLWILAAVIYEASDKPIAAYICLFLGGVSLVIAGA